MAATEGEGGIRNDGWTHTKQFTFISVLRCVTAFVRRTSSMELFPMAQAGLSSTIQGFFRIV